MSVGTVPFEQLERLPSREEINAWVEAPKTDPNELFNRSIDLIMRHGVPVPYEHTHTRTPFRSILLKRDTGTVMVPVALDYFLAHEADKDCLRYLAMVNNKIVPLGTIPRGSVDYDAHSADLLLTEGRIALSMGSPLVARFGDIVNRLASALEEEQPVAPAPQAPPPSSPPPRKRKPHTRDEAMGKFYASQPGRKNWR